MMESQQAHTERKFKPCGDFCPPAWRRNVYAGASSESCIWVQVAALFFVGLKFAGVGREESKQQH